MISNAHTFEVDLTQIEHLAQCLAQAFEPVKTELLAFADFLDQLIQDEKQRFDEASPPYKHPSLCRDLFASIGR
ncbi:MAG: hypothetical protein H8E35_16615 [Ardenticatenia bacterium]|nr:hypothetical protein [Ardenticatenia bacterium]